MKPQINLWFLQTHNSTVYGSDNISKLLQRGTHISDGLKVFFCFYYQCTDPKSDAAKHSLFKVRRILQNLQRNSELYWFPARYLSTDEQTIGSQVRHKDKLCIMFKDAGDGLQADAIFVNVDTPTFSFITMMTYLIQNIMFVQPVRESFGH